jgi:hypothetical protein
LKPLFKHHKSGEKSKVKQQIQDEIYLVLVPSDILEEHGNERVRHSDSLCFMLEIDPKANNASKHRGYPTNEFPQGFLHIPVPQAADKGFII